MGSLMAGWDSHPWNEEKVMTRSKTSLTKEEIEEFWRKRQLATEEHLKDAKAQSSGRQSEKVLGVEVLLRSPGWWQPGLQGAGTPSIDIPQVIAEELEIPAAMSPDWWRRSNWAFLNDPPEKNIMHKHSNYTAQYEAACKTTQAT